MKKGILLLLILVAILATGCSNKTENITTSTSQEMNQITQEATDSVSEEKDITEVDENEETNVKEEMITENSIEEQSVEEQQEEQENASSNVSQITNIEPKTEQSKSKTEQHINTESKTKEQPKIEEQKSVTSDVKEPEVQEAEVKGSEVEEPEIQEPESEQQEGEGLLALSQEELNMLLDEIYPGDSLTQYWIDHLPAEKINKYFSEKYHNDFYDYVRIDGRVIDESTVECVYVTQLKSGIKKHKIRFKVEDGIWSVIHDEVLTE